ADGRTPVGSEGEHGTLVASLAAGRGTGAASGVIGSAPEASVLAISIGFDTGDSDQQIADAVRWAVDHGADVINMSLTRNTLDWPTSWDDAFSYAMDHDVVIVAAAGNRGSGTDEVGAPATMPGVLTVAGVDRAGQTSRKASTQGVTIGVSAPSEELVGAMPDGSYARWSGTSGATPIVAGVVALVRAAHPGLDAANVIARITSTARDAGAPGTDVAYGFGLLDADAAVTAEVPHVDANPMGELDEWIRVNRR
ncbi:S8 family serine peptidase, partial [Schumannella luteola]